MASSGKSVHVKVAVNGQAGLGAGSWHLVPPTDDFADADSELERLVVQ